ncbi:MAG: CopG family transcriptional regulator [Deltaproteobacteria bacterium]|nr:MAG: CopG family transcriptional regulator [Deltaproteobacteria bacterium]
MKTTLQLDDKLIREAKARAAREGKTLTRLIELALRNYLRPQRRRKGRALRLHSRRARPIDGVDFSDRDTLYERMEELS